jgi:hypothetical protein
MNREVVFEKIHALSSMAIRPVFSRPLVPELGHQAA